MDFIKDFKKETEKSYKCIIPVPVTDDYVIQEKECSVKTVCLWSQHYILPAIVTEGVLSLGMNSVSTS